MANLRKEKVRESVLGNIYGIVPGVPGRRILKYKPNSQAAQYNKGSRYFSKSE